MADIRLPATHWASRVTILALLAAVLVGFAWSGALTGVAGWTAACAVQVTGRIWAPVAEQSLPTLPGGCLPDAATGR
ncbi:hypothetical protein J2S43_001643 [Catenuloplanes nepalensis]|uniref:Uncharacterized protein n=1 Tax=Catenuloplanes nepalensis TaxID=587533 RepID=A0ABT9MPX4_9ACTN|nr:hypothetical protein [Catenuloplanes nepalensis]MDP9793131.1 hypothetical protein [Catenuloplanes nepalensis]